MNRNIKETASILIVCMLGVTLLIPMVSIGVLGTEQNTEIHIVLPYDSIDASQNTEIHAARSSGEMILVMAYQQITLTLDTGLFLYMDNETVYITLPNGKTMYVSTCDQINNDLADGTTIYVTSTGEIHIDLPDGSDIFAPSYNEIHIDFIDGTEIYASPNTEIHAQQNTEIHIEVPIDSQISASSNNEINIVSPDGNIINASSNKEIHSVVIDDVVYDITEGWTK